MNIWNGVKDNLKDIEGTRGPIIFIYYFVILFDKSPCKAEINFSLISHIIFKINAPNVLLKSTIVWVSKRIR